MDKKCFVCHSLLTSENDSSEHIFLFRLGDTHPVKGIVCKYCNNWLGGVVDFDFVKTFKGLYKTVSGKSEAVSMTTEQGERFSVPIKNEQIENKPILSQSPFKFIDESNFSGHFYDSTDAETSMKKQKNRNPDKNINYNITKETSIPTFYIKPKIDKVNFTLEILKIQAEYLRSINYDVNTLGEFIFKYANVNKNLPNPFEPFEELLIHIFNSVIQPGFKYIPKNTDIIPGVSKAKVVRLKETDWMFISLFGKINMIIPIIRQSFLNLLTS